MCLMHQICRESPLTSGRDGFMPRLTCNLAGNKSALQKPVKEAEGFR